MSAKLGKSLRKVFEYDHPPEVVWHALTDRRALAEWLMPNNFEPVLGHRFMFKVDGYFGTTGVTDCQVLELDPPRRMVWSWAIRMKPGKKEPPPMRVSWTLEPTGRGTRPIFEQIGLDRLPFWMRSSMKFGWGTMHKRWLRQVMSRVERRAAGAPEFIPGAFVREKLCYKITSIRPEDGITLAPTREETAKLESQRGPGPTSP